MTLPDGLLLADKSAWERAGDPAVRAGWSEAVIGGRIVTCLPIRYELLYSVRDGDAFLTLERQLAALREDAITATVQRAAMAAQRSLAQQGPRHQRIPLADLLIAATAQEYALTVLHHARHFEHLQQVMEFAAARLV